jgi:hypothetical protein
MLRFMGLADLGGSELVLLTLIAACTSFAIGWIMDLIMNRVGFGILGNSFISMLGIGSGLAGYRYFYRVIDLSTLPVVILFIVFSIMFLLVALSWLRRVLKL